MKSLECLIDAWGLDPTIRLLSPAEESEVVALLDSLGKPYSKDVVEVYCITGGMDGSMDDRGFSLWPLMRVQHENRADAAGEMAFADFLINSFWYVFHYEEAGRSSVYGGYEYRKLAHSVEEFFNFRLDDPERLDLSFL